MSGHKGTLFVVSGPSGVGKGTLLSRLLEEYPEHAAFSVSATTRPARPGEVDGKNYFFLTREGFEQRSAQDDFLEHAEYAGNLYGTPRSFVEGLLAQGRDVILEIETQGAQSVMKRMPDCVSVFILPPSPQELEARLRGRGTEQEDVIHRRLEQAKREMDLAPLYRYQIVNEKLDTAYEALRAIYLANAGFMRETSGCSCKS